MIPIQTLRIRRINSTSSLSCLQRSKDRNHKRHKEKKTSVRLVKWRINAWYDSGVVLITYCVEERDAESHEKEKRVEDVDQESRVGACCDAGVRFEVP